MRDAMSSGTFARDAIETFRFVRTAFDAASGEAQLIYAFDQGPELVETLQFPGAPFALDAARMAAVERALGLLHLIAGVSYYKAAVPERLVVESQPLDADLSALLTEIYENGLGEFAYRNGLSLRGNIRFIESMSPEPSARRTPGPSDVHSSDNGTTPLDPGVRRDDGRGASDIAPSLGLRPHALTAIGGGKDSLVSIELLRSLGIEQSVAWIGSAPLIRACADRTGLPQRNITRQLSPLLFEYNKQGAYNGHIPVTAVNSAILVMAALLHDADQVVFSNERSASYGSLIPGTGEVNHQWSKGWDFERDFARYVTTHIAADLRYYSLLRPLSELAVARQFAKLDRYDAHFSSCNRNFHLLGERPASRWCGVCPKCHFVFLALAPFLPKPRLTAIFGRNLLDDAVLAPGFDALIEYQDHKPFECVGEGRESRAAFAELAQRPAWREDALVARFVQDILPQLDPADLALMPLLQPQGAHGIPTTLWSRVHETLRA